MSEDDSVELLSSALTQLTRLVADVAPDQRSAPTPCAGWDVATLVDHVHGDISHYIVAAQGGRPDWGAQVDHIGDEWVAEASAAAETLLAAWRAADLDTTVPAMGGTWPLHRVADQQTTEFAIHAWDLARATGRSVALDPRVGERALAFGRDMLRPEFRGPEGSGKAFGLEVPVESQAPVYDRLAGWFGRHPDWRPGG